MFFSSFEILGWKKCEFLFFFVSPILVARGE